MDFTELNRIAERENLPRKKVSDLEEFQQYMVTVLREVRTQWGPKIVAEFDGSFQVFLPSKLSAAILKDQQLFDQMCDAANKLSLFVMHLGKSKIKFSTC